MGCRNSGKDVFAIRTRQKRQEKMCMDPKRMKTSLSRRMRDGLMSSRSERMLVHVCVCVCVCVYRSISFRVPTGPRAAHPKSLLRRRRVPQTNKKIL